MSISLCFSFLQTGNQILSLGTLSKDQIYPLKLKGISICYSALKSALCGNYVSFGVFKLYGDNHFDNVLQAFVKMLLSVSHCDLLVRKLFILGVFMQIMYYYHRLKMKIEWNLEHLKCSLFLFQLHACISSSYTCNIMCSFIN